MGGAEPTDDRGRPDPLALLVDRACDRFEADWLAGRAPRIEDHLDAADPPQRPALLRQLVALELELRRGRGEDPAPGEYEARFPVDPADLSAAFAPDALTAYEVPPTAPRGVGVGVGDDTRSRPTGPAPARPPDPGDGGEEFLPVLGPDLRVLGRIGRGGMGVVYRARQVALDRVVAVKLMGGTHADPDLLARFRTEARAVARLDHPNIVQIYEVGESDRRPYIVMEFVDGGSLAQKLRGGPLPVRRSAQLAEELARAVHAAHLRGVVHRDLKPANVLLTADERIKVTDFGLAKLLSEAQPTQAGLTDTGMIIGTPSYMSPEQARGSTRGIGPAADVYALGVVLYEMLTGRPPFRGSSPMETLGLVLGRDPVPPGNLRPKLPRDLETVCLKCLEKDPSRRYESADELADDLRAFLGGLPIRGRRPGPRRRALDWVARRPATAALLGAGGVGASALLVGLWWSNAVLTGGLSVLALLAGSLWSQARLRAALRQLARQQAATERHAERLLLLGEMSRRLIAITDLGRLLLVLAETAARLADSELSTIFLTDRDRGEVWSKVKLDAGVGEIRVPLGVGVAGTVAVTGEVVNLTDAYADPRFHPEIDRQTGYRTRTLLTLPMAAPDGRIVGVLQVLNKRQGAFDADDEEVLGALAATAAVAVEIARQRS